MRNSPTLVIGSPNCDIVWERHNFVPHIFANQISLGKLWAVVTDGKIFQL
ncbi:hypothetical protein [Acidithiobacillus ferriphilus]|nr:hypothetical protein [Acidithiobacillus ferriphilus]